MHTAPIAVELTYSEVLFDQVQHQVALHALYHTAQSSLPHCTVLTTTLQLGVGAFSFPHSFTVVLPEGKQT